jgi:hypothetical protein
MTEPIPSVTYPLCEDSVTESEWLQQALLDWLNHEFIPEVVNETIAHRTAQIFLRQRLEGEDDLGSLVLAIATELRGFDFSHSFYGEFAVANAVSDLLMERLGNQSCCG